MKLKVIKKTSHPAGRQTEPGLVRQAVDGLGVDTHVRVKLPAETILRGHIQAIDERRFTLRMDGSGQLVPLRYDQVLQVRENPHVPILIGLFVGVAALIVLIVVLVRKKSGNEPFVSTIKPNTIQAGRDVKVRISGNNFAAGARLKFKKGDGPKPMASNVVVLDTNTLTATVAANGRGPSRDRVWHVLVTNSGGKTGKLKDGFTVTPLARIMQEI